MGEEMKYPKAEQHPLSIDITLKGMHNHFGAVLHIMAGTMGGTDAWFHNPNAKASAHIGISKMGKVYQWVDFADKAWAQGAGNPDYISVENEGRGGDPLTPAQISANAQFLEWAESQYHFGFANAIKPGDKGLGHHSMGAALWGGHLSCPGSLIIAQKPLILAKAKAIRAAKK
jgi:hypothetical protein